jgi:hypothetical protein
MPASNGQASSLTFIEPAEMLRPEPDRLHHQRKGQIGTSGPSAALPGPDPRRIASEGAPGRDGRGIEFASGEDQRIIRRKDDGTLPERFATS